MIIDINHLNKDFGDRHIVRDGALHIENKEKYALIGANGVGKTTFLRMIVGEETPDSGDIVTGKDVTIGYLPQQMGYHSDLSIYDELFAVRQDLIDMESQIRSYETQIAEASDDSRDSLLEKYEKLSSEFELNDGYAYRSRVLGVINGLGFDEDSMHTCINNLSGGQKTRVALGKLLLTEPDLLILDEPTNHLDMSSVAWLETYIQNYKGAVLIVSHDRYFLNKFADHVLELENGVLTVYPGDYSAYASQKAIRRITLLRSYEKQQAEIHHQEQVIDKLRQFNREKSIRRADSRQKMLDKIERIEKPVDEQEQMHFSLEPAVISGKDVLDVENLAKSFDDNHLFSDVNFSIKRGEKVAIIGDNGTGKTTLLRMISGSESIDNGTITLGTGVEIGYYDQEHGILHDDKTVFSEIQDDYPYLNNTDIRNTLAAFLFTEDDVFKPISSLSGGEKGRVSLAKLMLSEANLLLLDEPTNHLDIASREILEAALNDYTGTLVCVSHDRYFIDHVATRILDLTHEKFLDYGGGYQYYLEKKETVEQVHLGGASSQNSDNRDDANVSSSKLDWKEQKELEAKRRKLQREYDAVEARISELEELISDIDEQLSDPAVGIDLPRLQELTKSRDDADKELNDLLKTWEELSVKLES